MSIPATMCGLAFRPKTDLLVQLEDGLPLPHVKKGEVLVRVTHSTVNSHEFELAQLALMRTVMFLSGARGPVKTGLEFAGVVASDGAAFREGDAVMGYINMYSGARPHAEYVSIPEAYLSRVPASVSPAEASTLPMSGLTALTALRDVAKVKPGQDVLVLGATGGVGVLTVQIAKHLGATVTAVASQAHHDRLRQLGASHTVDYRQTPITDMKGPFHAILDFSNTRSLKDVRHLLTSDGVFVPADPVRNALDILLSRHAAYLMVDRGSTEGLEELAGWVDEGILSTVTDQVFPLDQWRDAVARSHQRGRLGRTVLSFEAPLTA